MIENFGVGIDIVYIPRFKKLPYKTNQKFYNKIFLKDEIDYCLNFKNSFEHFAGKFAIKESVKKSIVKKIDFLDIKIQYENSKPIVILKNKPCYKFIISVSHENNYATAIVICEKVSS